MQGRKFGALVAEPPPVGAAAQPASRSALAPIAARPVRALRVVNVTGSSKIARPQDTGRIEHTLPNVTRGSATTFRSDAQWLQTRAGPVMNRKYAPPCAPPLLRRVPSPNERGRSLRWP